MYISSVSTSDDQQGVSVSKRMPNNCITWYCPIHWGIQSINRIDIGIIMISLYFEHLFLFCEFLNTSFILDNCFHFVELLIVATVIFSNCNNSITHLLKDKYVMELSRKKLDNLIYYIDVHTCIVYIYDGFQIPNKRRTILTLYIWGVELC